MIKNQVVSHATDIEIYKDGRAEVTVGGTTLEPFIRALQVDPKGVIEGSGRTVGFCVVCGKQLKTAESKSLGVGPECRKTFQDVTGLCSVLDKVEKVPPAIDIASTAVAVGDKRKREGGIVNFLVDGRELQVPLTLADHTSLLKELEEGCSIELPLSVTRGLGYESVKKSLQLLEKLCEHYSKTRPVNELQRRNHGSDLVERAFLSYQELCFVLRLFEWLYVDVGREYLPSLVKRYLVLMFVV